MGTEGRPHELNTGATTLGSYLKRCGPGRGVWESRATLRIQRNLKHKAVLPWLPVDIGKVHWHGIHAVAGIQAKADAVAVNREPDDTLLSAPTVAYSLVRSNALLVVERYRENVPVLRHEALHFIIWRAFKRYGHPEEFFMPCDKAYSE